MQEEVIDEPVTPSMRLLLVGLACLPLLMVLDYREALWPFRPTSLIPALLALPALALSVVLLGAAVASHGRRWRFGDAGLTIEHEGWRRRRQRHLPYKALKGAALSEERWTDGEPSYALQVTLAAGEVVASPSMRDALRARQLLQRLQARIEREQAT